MPERTVEFEYVLSWKCPDCGQRNYHHGTDVKPPKNEDEAAEQAMAAEYFDCEIEDLYLEPKIVFCVKCEASFAPETYEEEDEE